MNYPIILTSGTLHPLETLEQELGINCEIQLQNLHVVSKDNVNANIVKSVNIDTKQLINYNNYIENNIVIDNR